MTKTVADIMTPDPVTVYPTTPLNQVIETLAQQRISGVPVVNEAGTLVGIVSEGDLIWKESGATPPPYVMFLDSVIYLENPSRYERELHKVLGETAGDVMTKEVVTIAADKPLPVAARLMHDRAVHRLPVVNETGHVVGMLTRGDIIRAMAAELL